MSRHFSENHDRFCFTVSKTGFRTRRLRRRPLPLLPPRQANKSWLPSVKKHSNQYVKMLEITLENLPQTSLKLSVGLFACFYLLKHSGLVCPLKLRNVPV